MPEIRPIAAVTYATPKSGDISSLIAPPYDVLDETAKARLLGRDPHNVVAIDLPHLPDKTVGPDAVYTRAANTYRHWLAKKILVRRPKPVVLVYQQTYTHAGREFKRRGLIAGVGIQPFGKAPPGALPGVGGGIHPHEQTFSGPKEDRMKLMRATRAQLSPIFGLYSDADKKVHGLLSRVIESGKPTFFGKTLSDNVLHEVWAIESPEQIKPLTDAIAPKDIFIADGHHRYTTAMNYRQGLIEKHAHQPPPELPPDHPANFCLFVLVAMQDPGMIVLPTHRVLGGMEGFTFEKFVAAAKGKLDIKPFTGGGGGNDLAALEAALPKAGPHAIGLFVPGNQGQSLAIATTVEPDPLKKVCPKQSEVWRQLDVAIVQHLIVDGICQPAFCPAGQTIQWKFPHTLPELKAETQGSGSQLGLLLQATPLDSVRLVSEAGELMPQKSTFFYPKLATGLVIHPIQ